MELQNLKILEWFIGLAGMDLEKMGPADLVKIKAEAELMAHGLNPWMVKDPILEPETAATIESLMRWFAAESENSINLKECQSRILTFMETLEKEKDNAKRPVHLVNVETGEISGDLFPPFKAMLSTSTPISIDLREFDGKINVTYSSNNITETLLIYFVKALNGLSIKSIRCCLECKKWFLHLSLRRKDFCSNRCAARKASKNKRQSLKEDKEKEAAYNKVLAAGAERARKSYENRVRKEHPKATIERRPRKHTD